MPVEARSRRPARHLPAADEALARPRLPAGRRGRLDARRHGARMARPGGARARARCADRADRRNALPPRPRRRRRPGARRDRRAGRQGELDYEQCEHVWGNPRWPQRMAAWFAEHGVPKEITDDLIEVGSAYGAFIRFARDPERLREGDRVDGWEVIAVPGHADGHIALARDGALVAGDHLLTRISPAVGLYPDSRPDPLADYLDSLRHAASSRRESSTRPRRPDRGRGRTRARADRAPSRRLDATEAALGDRPRLGLRSRARSSAASSRPPGAVRGRRDALAPRPPRRGGPRGALAKGAAVAWRRA